MNATGFSMGSIRLLVTNPRMPQHQGALAMCSTMKKTPYMRTLRFCSLGATAVTLLIGYSTGCTIFGSRFAPFKTAEDSQIVETTSSDGKMPFDVDRAVRANNDSAIQVRLLFEVERFLVESNSLKGLRERVLSYADELRISPTTSNLLSRNGFRIGAMQSADYAALQVLLGNFGARSEQSTHRVSNGSPLTLDLGPLGSRETVFIINADGKPVGKTFENATRLIHVDYDVALDGESVTSLRITPEIFKQGESPYWRLRDGEIGYQKDYQGVLYRSFAVQVAIGKDEVLLICPDSGADNPLSLGRKMLSEVIDGRQWESILCVRPILYVSRPLRAGGTK